MKRLIQFVVLIGLLAISLTGCGDKNTESAHPKNVDAGHSKPGGDSDTDSSEMNVLHGREVLLPKKVVAAIESLCEKVPGEDGEYKVENVLSGSKYFDSSFIRLCGDDLYGAKNSLSPIEHVLVDECSNDQIVSFSECVSNVFVSATPEQKEKCVAILDNCKPEPLTPAYMKAYNDFCEAAKTCKLKYDEFTDPAGPLRKDLEEDSYCQKTAKTEAPKFRTCRLEDVNKLISCLKPVCGDSPTIDPVTGSRLCYQNFEKSCLHGGIGFIF